MELEKNWLLTLGATEKDLENLMFCATSRGWFMKWDLHFYKANVVQCQLINRRMVEEGTKLGFRCSWRPGQCAWYIRPNRRKPRARTLR